MWIITTTGFYSIVKKPTDEPGKLTIRARVRKDLEELQDKYLPTMSKIIESEDSDYRFRAFATPEDLVAALSTLVLDIDYPNFKDEITNQGERFRPNIYGNVWAALMALELENEDLP